MRHFVRPGIIAIAICVLGFIVMIGALNTATKGAEHVELTPTLVLAQTVAGTPAPTHTRAAPRPVAPSPATNVQPRPTTNPHPPTPSPEELVRNLAIMNRTFTLASEADPTQAHLTREQVLKIISQQYSDMNATATTATLGWLTDEEAKRAAQSGIKVDTTFIAPRLVWIISFSGVLMSSSGPPEAQHQTSNEYDTIVDAQSGEELQGFTWTR